MYIYIYMKEVVEIQTTIPQRTFSVCRGDRVDIISIYIQTRWRSLHPIIVWLYQTLAIVKFFFFCFSPIFMSKLLTRGHQETTATGENKTKLIFSLNRGQNLGTHIILYNIQTSRCCCNVDKFNLKYFIFQFQQSEIYII